MEQLPLAVYEELLVTRGNGPANLTSILSILLFMSYSPVESCDP